MTRPLTRQELHVLRLLDLGTPNSCISEVLGLSKNTVKVHKYNLYKKLFLVGLSKSAAHIELKKFCAANPDLFEGLVPQQSNACTTA
jgi:DNA-binding NarL/FixJ family response regulator